MSFDQLISGINRIQVDTTETTLSFEGRGLKLITADDAQEVVDELEKSTAMTTLVLKGNTINVPAAEKIAKSLEKCHNLKRTLWSDIFTGRSKTESPPALKLMCDALLTAQVCLTELDLSDNAFGPAGADSIKDFLQSSCAFTLQVLKLNNCGLGSTGGKIIAESLISCFNNAPKVEKTFKLKVFIAGRNRLEIEGSTALAEAFKLIGTLEEIGLPQNGIYYTGVTALAEAFANNPDLRNINLEDNTLTALGATAIAKVLPKLRQLKILNLNDCLLRSKGASRLAKALKDNCVDLEELLICGNEINRSAALEIGTAVYAKPHLQRVDFGGNNIGEHGIDDLFALFGDHGISEKLIFSADDEGVASEGDMDEFQDINQEEPEEGEVEQQDVEDYDGRDSDYADFIDHFLVSFDAETLCDLGEDGPASIVETLQEELYNPYYAVHLILRISNLITPSCQPQIEELAVLCCYQILNVCCCGFFVDILCQKLGLIKDGTSAELKRPKNLYGVSQVLKECSPEYYKTARDVVRFLIERRLKSHENEKDIWNDLYSAVQ